MDQREQKPKGAGGRPPRGDQPARVVVRVPAELKRWLAHRAIDEDRDMGRIVEEALETYRRTKGRIKP
jgi:hypothetical protein